MTDATASLHIVLPVDRSNPSPELFAYASAIARPGDDILVLNAVPLSDVNPVVLPKSTSLPELRRQVQESALEELNALVADIEAPPGVTLRTSAVDGSPADVIVQHAPSADSSLIIMSTHGRGAIGRVAYGSVADRVTRTSACPILLVRRTASELPDVEPIRRLVVPLDGSSRSERSIPNAIALAQRLSIPILLIAVSEIERLAAIYGATLSAAAYSELAEESEAELVRLLEGVATRVKEAGVDVSLTVVSGAVAHAIDAATEPGDLIVMTSHGRGGVRRWILGSVAERLARTSKAPVMLVPSM